MVFQAEGVPGERPSSGTQRAPRSCTGFRSREAFSPATFEPRQLQQGQAHQPPLALLSVLMSLPVGPMSHSAQVHVSVAAPLAIPGPVTG